LVDLNETSLQNAAYFVILDTNIWVSERLLQSSLGSAALYALATDSALIILPEIVEMEVELVLEKQADRAVDDLRKNVEFLRQISGHQKIFHAVPTKKALKDGVGQRLKELDGVIIRAPFTIEHARSALHRILNHLPPSGDNNEQFRDCCIWAVATDFSASRVVHLITNDGAFYSGRDRRQGMAESLRASLNKIGHTIELHSSLNGFLEAISHSTIETLEKEVLLDKIANSVIPIAREYAAERATSHRSQRFELTEAKQMTIKGYATPKPTTIAVAFEATFDLGLIDLEGLEERQTDTILILNGSCSYDAIKREISDVTVKSWRHRIKDGLRSSSMSLDPAFQDQMTETRYI
jgi:hypothetical protein